MVSQKEFFTGFELRRKLAHMLVGCAFIMLINLFYEYSLVVISLLFAGATLTSAVARYKRPKLLIRFLEMFDKPHDLAKFPAKGAVFYTAGALSAVLFFPQDIASASIAVLAFGDSISHIVGRFYGKTKVIVNEKKLLEGTIAGIIAGTIAASFFVSFPISFFGAAFGMMAEAVELEYLGLDDNVFIPVVSGIVMLVLISL
ncbi:MAG: hypothetical protein HGA85_05840 [Nanoarchaeota archaeon]|nr:hypothetical protein [Nanoarchaeota archaeon]